jgi:hypothetical protein
MPEIVRVVVWVMIGFWDLSEEQRGLSNLAMRREYDDQRTMRSQEITGKRRWRRSRTA